MSREAVGEWWRGLKKPLENNTARRRWTQWAQRNSIPSMRAPLRLNFAVILHESLDRDIVSRFATPTVSVLSSLLSLHRPLWSPDIQFRSTKKFLQKAGQPRGFSIAVGLMQTHRLTARN